MVVREKVLVIRSIRVDYRLDVEDGQRETAERVHGFHAGFCPVARSLEGAIEIETHLHWAGEPE